MNESQFGAFLEQTEEDWDKDINLNLKGALFCCQALLPIMMEEGHGKIVDISSGSAKLGHPVGSAYNLVKGGIDIFTRNLARMVIGSGITVNRVSPGWSRTNFSKDDKEALRERFLPKTPMGRGTELQDIANAVAVPASDVSADSVGQVICLDGGWTMQRVSDLVLNT